MSVKQNKKTGTWFFEFTKDKQSYFKSGFRTKQQAEDAKAAKFDEIIKIQTRPDLYSRSSFNYNITFGEACDWYLKTITPTKRDTTSDQFMLNLLQGYFGRDRLVRDITPDDVRTMRSHLSNTVSQKTKLKLSAQSVNGYHALLRAVIYALIDHDKYDGKNPAARVQLQKLPKTKPRFITEEELAAITAEVQKHRRLWPYYFIALHTGMRLGEVTSIRVKDVSLGEQSIFLPVTKNGESRHVPMSPKLKEFVVNLMKGKKLEDKLIDNVTTKWTVSDWFRDITKGLGFPKITFHCLRHTFVHRLLNKGKDIYKVSKLVGHSSIEVTQSTYGHLSNRDLQSVVDEIDALV